MVLIIGGAYQGKLDWAITQFVLTEDDIYICSDTKIDFSRRCIYRLEEFTLACGHEGTDPVAYFQQNKENWEESIVICRDIFCGVVPMGADLRLWRNETGRLCRYLTQHARQVSRIFCGLEQRLK